jgi:hypothetical protein
MQRPDSVFASYDACCMVMEELDAGKGRIARYEADVQRLQEKLHDGRRMMYLRSADPLAQASASIPISTAPINVRSVTALQELQLHAAEAEVAAAEAVLNAVKRYNATVQHAMVRTAI